jgi:hypothetical protein
MALVTSGLDDAQWVFEKAKKFGWRRRFKLVRANGIYAKDCIREANAQFNRQVEIIKRRVI